MIYAFEVTLKQWPETDEIGRTVKMLSSYAHHIDLEMSSEFLWLFRVHSEKTVVTVSHHKYKETPLDHEICVSDTAIGLRGAHTHFLTYLCARSMQHI